MSSVLYSCCLSAYIFTKKRTPSEENFNNYAKILITPILYRGTTREAYLELSRNLQWSFFTKAVNNFRKNPSPQMFNRILITSLNSERV